MWISDLSIKRPVFATMAIASFVVLGIVSIVRLGIDLFPEVSFPFVQVSIVYPGASPEEVETLVVKPVEDAVAGINGVKRIESHANESLGRVGIEFRLEVDPQAAAAEVREKVAAIRYRLPKEVEDPTIVRFDVSAMPVMTFAVGASQRSDATRRQIEDDLKPLIEQIDGVAAVDVNGGQIREIQVDLDPGRLEALQLPVSVVAQTLATENLDVPGGKVTRDGQDISLRTKGEFQSVGEVEQVILRSTNGSTVRVKDVGTVVDGFAERTSTTRLNGADAVSFSIRKQSGANTVEISRRVKALLDRVAPNFPQLRIDPVHDDADFIKVNVREVRNHIIFGGMMAVLIIFLFMRDWRSTVISALALPTSVVSTFWFMYVVGFTINMMTLMAMSLVIGILIDDAVVVRENIYRHMEHGEDAMTAARRGTAEIGLAVMATTFTILAVFVPVGFMTGIVGQFFKSFALTIAFAVSMSLLIAFTLDPMLSSRFVRYIPPEERMKTRAGRLFERWGRAYERVDRAYHAILGRALARPWTTLALAAAVFLSSLSLLTFMGTEFVPVEDRSEFQVIAELPPGTSFEQSVETVSRIEQEIRREPEVRQIFSIVGDRGQARTSVVRVKLTNKQLRTRGIAEIKAAVRTRLKQMPFVDAKVADPEMMQSAPYEPPISVYVRGDDIAELQRVSGELMARVRRIPGAVDVSSSLVSGQPEVLARVRRDLAADLGFSVGSVAMQMRGMVEGTVPTKFREGDREHDIRVRLAPAFRNDFGSVARTPLYSPAGALVRTGDIVEFAPEVGPSNIERENRRRQAKIGIDLTGRPLGDVSADVQKAIEAIRMPANFEVGFAGDVELMQETASSLGLALLLAVTFIYIVLASQFESFLEPFLIMLALPLALAGALILLLLSGNNLGMPAMIGMVMLMGLVTKNAILLIDYTNQLRREQGLGVREAILQAGPVRLRPILMTTMAMILGMTPSAILRGDGSEFRAPISIATIGGLITSTLLTLVVVPVAYLLLDRMLERVKVWRRSEMPPAVRTVVRVTGLLLLLALLGGIVTVARAFAETTVPGRLKPAPTTAALTTTEVASSKPAPATTVPATATTTYVGAGFSRPDASQDTGAPLVLTFDQAMALAMRQNESLKATQAALRAAEGRVREARTGFLPSVDMNFMYTPAQDFPVLKIPAGIFGPKEQEFKAAFTRQNIMRLDVNQPIWTGGRLENAYALQAAASDAQRLSLDRARQQLALQVVQAFYAALMNDHGVTVTAEGVRLAENHLALAKVRFEAGTAARLDVLRAEVELANAKARLIRMRSQAQIAYQALRTVLSLPQATPLVLRGTLDQPIAVAPMGELMAKIAVRPDVRAAGEQTNVARRSLALASADLKPSFGFTGNVQYQEDALNKLFGNNTRSYQFGLAFRVPLFAAPHVAARRGTAQAQIEQAEHGRSALIDSARLDVTSAYTELEAAREIVATQQKAVDLARESMSIAEVSYENGVITSSELNDARLSLLETEWELMQAKYALVVAAEKTRFAAGTN